MSEKSTLFDIAEQIKAAGKQRTVVAPEIIREGEEIAPGVMVESITITRDPDSYDPAKGRETRDPTLEPEIAAPTNEGQEEEPKEEIEKGAGSEVDAFTQFLDAFVKTAGGLNKTETRRAMEYCKEARTLASISDKAIWDSLQVIFFRMVKDFK